MSGQVEDVAGGSGGRSVRVAALLVAALGGAAVLMQEILAAGWLAPLYGNGIRVWAVVLSISLTSLAVGAWLGRPRRTAMPSDRSLKFASLCLALGGACTVAAMAYVAQVDATRPPAVGVVATLLLAPALIAWGMMSPRLVQAYSDTGAEPGRAAGATYAVGTMGSAGGALAAGLWLIPSAGLVEATWRVTLVLCVGAFASSLIVRANRRALFVAAVAIVALAWLCRSQARAATAVSDHAAGEFGLRRVARVDSFYGRHEVLEDDVSRYLMVDGVLQTSKPLLSFGEAAPGALLQSGNALELALWMRPVPGEALVIGLGGGTFPNKLVQSGWRVRAVEIDPHVVALAKRYFDLSIPVAVQDGRRALNLLSGTVDLIVLDVYRGELLPAHLFSESAFARMASCLGKRGLLAVNLIGQPDGEAVRAILRSAMHAFSHIALYAPDRGAAIAPMTLFASRDTVEVESSRDRAAEAGVTWPRPIALESIDLSSATRLTDVHNPVAFLRQRVARLWRERSVRRFRRGAPGPPSHK